MKSILGRLALKATSSIVMLAVVAVPGIAFPQVTIDSAASDRQLQIADQIEEEQKLNGLHSPDLITPLTALGLSHQEQGDHGLAAGAFERARQVVRVNYGLNSLNEAPLLRQLVRSEEALGNVELAWDLEQELLALAKRHPDDLRTVAIFREFAEKRLDMLDRYLGGAFPPQIVLGCYYARTPTPLQHLSADGRPAYNANCHAGSRRRVVLSLLKEARSYQAQAIDTLLRNGRHSSDDFQQLVTEVIRTSYEHGDAFIEQAFRPIVDYESQTSVSLLTRASTLIQLADLNLVRVHRARRFGDYESVLELYKEAYKRLDGEGRGQASIDEIFSPDMPVVLPAFAPNPLDSEESSKSAGYIDVAFDITHRGESENAEILDMTNATRADRRELLRLIKRSSFRPRAINGHIAETARVSVRYYINE